MPMSIYFYTLKVTKTFSGGWKFTKTVRLKGERRGFGPIIIDKRHY